MRSTDRFLSFLKHSRKFVHLDHSGSEVDTDQSVVAQDSSDSDEEGAPRFPFAVSRSESISTLSGIVDDMGKSNKFDFTNRPNSGVRLGKSIGTALKKEAEKLHKHCEKELEKARKHSVDSAVSGSDVVDPLAHHLDLQAPNKDLGDEGASALADGLEIALLAATNANSLALEDLNLSGNGITVASLARLAPIIALAKHDLKTLNLSGNAIKVDTPEEVVQWEIFLRAFVRCYRLRRLDLSNNNALGNRAMEVLAWVHTNELPISPLPPFGDGSVLSLASEKADEDDAHLPYSAGNDTVSEGKSLADAQLIRRRCGLRSIPYLTLQNTGLTDAGALWLSYVLEDHCHPVQLIDGLNATLASSTIQTYQQGTVASGIDWSNNSATLSKDGLMLLQKAEAVRLQALFEDQNAMGSSVFTDDSSSIYEEVALPRRTSMTRRYSRALPGERRASIRSIRTADGGEHEASELESARKMIQRHVIEHDRVSSVGLWHAALTVVRCSRTLFVEAPKSRKYFTGETLFPQTASDTERDIVTAPSTNGKTLMNGKSKKLSVDTANNKGSVGRRGSYAATLTATGGGTIGEPELAITSVTNSPTTPKAIFKPHRKDAFSRGCNLPAVTEKLHGLILRDDSPQRFIKYQQDRKRKVAGGNEAYRDISIPSHLPRAVIDHVMGFIMTERELAVLTEEQWRAAFDWGHSRAALTTALEWRKKDESSQVWMLLDSIKCLAYSQ